MMRRWVRHTVSAIILSFTAAEVPAKAPGTTYCYKNVCHRVKTLTETALDIGKPMAITASHYDAPWRDPFNPDIVTSSGETFQPGEAQTAASPIYPDGTRLLVFEPSSGAAAVVRVNNAGPYWGGRQLDVSRAVAEQLGFAKRGTANLTALVLSAPTSAESRYEAGRAYSPVPGYLGVFASLDEARGAWDGHPQAMIAAAAARDIVEPPEAPVAERIVVIPEKEDAAPESGAAKEKAEAGSTPPHGRGTHASGGQSPKAKEPRKGRVVLKPVKLRRPATLAKLAKEKSKP